MFFFKFRKGVPSAPHGGQPVCMPHLRENAYAIAPAIKYCESYGVGVGHKKHKKAQNRLFVKFCAFSWLNKSQYLVAASIIQSDHRAAGIARFAYLYSTANNSSPPRNLSGPSSSLSELEPRTGGILSLTYQVTSAASCQCKKMDWNAPKNARAGSGRAVLRPWPGISGHGSASG